MTKTFEDKCYAHFYFLQKYKKAVIEIDEKYAKVWGNVFKLEKDLNAANLSICLLQRKMNDLEREWNGPE